MKNGTRNDVRAEASHQAAIGSIRSQSSRTLQEMTDNEMSTVVGGFNFSSFGGGGPTFPNPGSKGYNAIIP